MSLDDFDSLYADSVRLAQNTKEADAEAAEDDAEANPEADAEEAKKRCSL